MKQTAKVRLLAAVQDPYCPFPCSVQFGHSGYQMNDLLYQATQLQFTVTLPVPAVCALARN